MDQVRSAAQVRFDLLEMVMEHAAELVRAMAYISRHGLRMSVKSHPVGTPGHFYIVFKDGDVWGIRGGGSSLYEAVLDYQRESGIGWGE
jgi:hypothetical protein